MKYRAEIDGLRAVAVVPVILFHAGFQVFGGGFVGVDVFFVISGYLITGILIAELEAGNFSIVRFYERRARRILPALFLVVACCLPFAWAWMLPSQFMAFSQSIVAVALFSSNFLFWRESGYFAAAAELKPLLHTWSLAVEEQYYLFFPVFLALIWRMGRKRVVEAILALALASLVLSEWGWRNMPEANFYLAPTRAWELLAGSLCALRMHGRLRVSNDWLAGAGLALVVSAIFFFDDGTPFPSLYTLAPVAGTALVILFGGAGTGVARLLSMRPFVGIGLISYSAYLWHQPLFAFARIHSITEPTEWVMALMALLSLVLAYFSWRFVELPFRQRSGSFHVTPGWLFRFCGATGAALALFGTYGNLSGGIKPRMSAAVSAIDEYGRAVDYRCPQVSDCYFGSSNQEPADIAFVGDSHMGRYAYALDPLFEDEGLRVKLLAHGWCPPLLDFGTADAKKNSLVCNGEYNSALRAVIDNPAIRTIVIAAEWSVYTTGIRHDAIAAAYDYRGEGQAANTNVAANAEEFAKAFSATLQAMKASGKRVIIIGPVPEFGFSVPIALAKSALFGRAPDSLRLPIEGYQARNADVFRTFESMSGDVDYVDVSELLCRDGWCYPYDDNHMPLYNDGNHLDGLGLDVVATYIFERIGPYHLLADTALRPSRT